MKFSQTLLSVAFAATAVSAVSTSNICETSDASPYLHNVNEMIDNLSSAPQGEIVCNNYSGCGGTVTKYSGSGGAAFMLCGDSYRCGNGAKGLPCSGATCPGAQARIIGAALGGLRDQCQGPDSKGDIRVGGIVSTDYGNGFVSEIKLFSKPG